ncbi:MAG: penicillin-binding protein activator [Gammaproteobacteria bacterium]|nr:penicillin-binding protein activator [Gammaproteobacteria bacterium]
MKLMSDKYKLKPMLAPLFILFFVFLSGCSKVGGNDTFRKTPQSTPYTLPAEAYIGLANRQVGEEKSALMIMAAGRVIDEGRWQQGLQWLSDLPALPPLMQSEKQVLLAKIALLRGRSQEAISYLSAVKDAQGLPGYYQLQYHEILAHAYHKKGRLAESVGERLILDKLLPTEAERARNRRVMWLTLTSLPVAELNTMASEWSPTPEWQGWLKLAMIAKTQGLSRDTLLKRVVAWQAEFPSHPANSLLPTNLTSMQLSLYATPHQVALLLPMTGPLAGPGHAVYDGFMGAHQQSGLSSSLSVRVYDTAHGDVSGLYHQALQDGADWVIGPLSKQDVLQVVSLTHPVPTILLNDVGVRPAPQGYLLGLSPVSEATQVALKASQQGYHRALVIAPNGAWGDEVLAGFLRTWARRQGVVVETLRYDQQTPLPATIRALLHYRESMVKVGSGQKAAGARRQDFDMVFLLAYPSKAREIVPLLRYYYVGNAPIFSTSAVYMGSADAQSDRDLDGVIFCDMPFVFRQDLPNRHWPEQLNSYSRLYALGLDSFALTYQLNNLLLFPALGLDDKSGVLYLNRNNQIVRVMAWGQFKQGRPVLWSEQ